MKLAQLEKTQNTTLTREIDFQPASLDIWDKI